MQKHVYATSSVSSTARGRVGLGLIQGVVTASEARRIIIDSPSWGRCRPLAHVADYSGATMAINEGALLGSAIQAQRHGVVLAPTALVVSRDQLAMFDRYCQASMSAGVLKAAFLRLEDAVRWSARQAAVREDWQAVRNGLRSAR